MADEIKGLVLQEDPDVLEWEEEGFGIDIPVEIPEFDPEDYEDDLCVEAEESLETMFAPRRGASVNLPEYLRDWGLKVRVVKGWTNRSANGSFKPEGIVVHHTASNKRSGNAPSLGIVTDGRAGIPGPLSQFLLARDGTVYVVGQQRANHAGLGGGFGIVPKDSANAYMYGIEAENDGIGEPWPDRQLQAYYRLCAALQVLMGNRTANYVIGHKEWTSRKIDPAGITMDDFRKEVEKAMARGKVEKVYPKFHRLKPGKRRKDIKRLNRRLRTLGFLDGCLNNHYSKRTKRAVRKFKRSKGWLGISGKMNKATYRALWPNAPEP